MDSRGNRSSKQQTIRQETSVWLTHRLEDTLPRGKMICNPKELIVEAISAKIPMGAKIMT